MFSWEWSSIWLHKLCATTSSTFQFADEHQAHVCVLTASCRHMLQRAKRKHSVLIVKKHKARVVLLFSCERSAAKETVHSVHISSLHSPLSLFRCGFIRSDNSLPACKKSWYSNKWISISNAQKLLDARQQNCICVPNVCSRCIDSCAKAME